MSDDKKACFIIMPITTPDAFRDIYRDGKDHFHHVLDCLLIPAVEKAGYKAIPPSAKGSDLIHAEIVSNLETADLVLCDMSCLNPNVFFEFGIRTALNKPVCVVKDEHTKDVPFDAGILNHQQYKSTLEPWELEGEVEQLAEHLRQSGTRSEGQNTLWKYFGLKKSAEAFEGGTDADSKLEYLRLQMDSIQEKLSMVPLEEGDFGLDAVHSLVTTQLPRECRFTGSSSNSRDRTIQVDYKGRELTRPEESRICKRIHEYAGWTAKFKFCQ